jgi:hypothetical protein
MSEIDIQKIIEGIQQLQQLREELLAGDLSPEGTWIHEYEITRFYPGSGNTEWYRYAKWQAHEPIFLRNPKRKTQLTEPPKEPGYTKHQHIGRVDSSTGLGMDESVKEAYQSWRNRKRLEAVEEVLREIQSILIGAERFKVKGRAVEDAE